MDCTQAGSRGREMGGNELIDFSKKIDPENPYCPKCNSMMSENEATHRFWCLNDECWVLWRYKKSND